MVGKVVLKMWAMMWACSMLYKAVVQLMLLYRSEIWVVTGAMHKVLEGFSIR